MQETNYIKGLSGELLCYEASIALSMHMYGSCGKMAESPGPDVSLSPCAAAH